MTDGLDEFDELLGDIGKEESEESEESDALTSDLTEKPLEVTDKDKTPATPEVEVKAEGDESDIPQLMGDDYPLQYIDLVDRVQYQYKCLPVLNYKEIYEELSDLAIKSNPSPTLQGINDEIQKVQAAKERLSEIYRHVERNFFLKKRSVDIIESAWAKYTNEKSADKRKGDAVLRVSNFTIDFALVEACYRVCQHVIKNLDSCHESLSRQITVNQLLLKMNDFSRGGLPDYDFEDRKRQNSEDNENNENNDGNDDSERTELEDEHF